MLKKDLTIGWAVTINLILLNISMCVYPFSETGDDDVLMAMASGCFGEPAAHLVFINICWAAVIRILICWFPAVNWYFILQFLLLFFAFATILYVTIKMYGEKNGILLGVLVLLPYMYEGYVAFQFTKTAGILTAAGCFCLFYCFHKEFLQHTCIWGLILVWMGCCYRFAMSAAVVALCLGSVAGAALIDLLRQKKRGLLKKKTMQVILILLLGMFGLREIDHLMYQSKAWQDYQEYNYYRGCVRDFPIHPYEGNEKAYAAIGVSRTEYENLLNWNIADPKVYTAKKLKEIFLLKDGRMTTAKVSNATLLGFFQFLTGQFVKNKMFLLFWMIAALLLILTTQKRNFLNRMLIIFSAVFGVNLVFFIRGRYGVNRVDICIWLAAILMLFVQEGSRLSRADTETEIRWKIYSFFIVYAVSAGITAGALKQHLQMWNTEKQVQADYQEIRKYIEADPKGHYFMDACAAHYGYGIPWYQPYPEGTCENLIYLGGWYTNSPLTLSQWQKNGIKNPFRDMCALENAYIIDRYDHIKTTCAYMQEHYEDRVEMKLVFVAGDYKIYKVSNI